MTLFRPEWLLLGALLPLIVLLYFKRQQVVEYRVSSLEFWAEAVREKQGLRVRRIDRYLPLVLQLLLGLLLVLAAAGPVWVRQVAGERVVIALDASISMQAAEGSATRFAVAGEEAGRIIRNLPGDSAITIVLLAGGARELVADAAPREALAALAKAECTSLPLDANLAAGYLEACSAPVVVVTDKELPLGDRVVQVGGELDNAGITGAAYDFYSGSVFYAVKNYSRDSKRVTVSLWSSGDRIDIATLTVPAGAQEDFSFPAPEAAGVLTLKLEQTDMLEADNRYFVPAGDAGKKKVLLSGNDFFLARALAAMADVTLVQAGDPASCRDCREVILAGGAAATALPEAAGVWYLAPEPGMTAEDKVRNVALEPADSPLTENLVLQGVYLEEATPLIAGEGMQTVLQAGGATVLAAGIAEGRKTVYSTIDFTRTNLVLLPEFPVLVSNIVNWLDPGATPAHPPNPPASLVTGEAGSGTGEQARPAGPLFSPLGNIIIAAALVLLVVDWEVYNCYKIYK